MKRILFLVIITLMVACKKDSKTTNEVITTPKELSAGVYRAALTVQDNKELPFVFEVAENKTITIANAEERITVNDVVVENDSVFIRMEVFDAVIKAKIDDQGNLKGTYLKAPKNHKVPFYAMKDVHFRYPRYADKHAPIAGKWEVTFSPGTPNEYKAIGMFKDSTNNIVTGTFLTETGDYRFLEGVLDNTNLKLSCFDGAHAFLFDGKVTKDSITSGMFYSGNHYKEPWVAVRNDAFELRDAEQLTFLKEGYEKLAFSFPDLDGNMISLEDSRFKDKAVIVQIMGSWCPNCLDESRYLSKFYTENKNKDIALVALAFENAKDETKAIKNLKRLKDRLKINYPILLAQVGSSDKKLAAEKLPMLNHILSYPTTIFIDKKGQVRKIHTGFNGPATGEKFETFKKEFEAFVAQLASE